MRGTQAGKCTYYFAEQPYSVAHVGLLRVCDEQVSYLVYVCMYG
jgi:hypothetical protein